MLKRKLIKQFEVFSTEKEILQKSATAKTIMKRQIFILTFLLSINFCIGQTEYVGRAILDNCVEKFTLVDTISGIKFTLDSTQIYVTAIDKSGKQLWRTDPWKDNNLMEYRVKRPIIVKFGFANNQWTDNKEVIWITYNNTQFGIIDKLTGKFTWFGQD